MINKKSENTKHNLLISLYQKNITTDLPYSHLHAFRRKVEEEKSGPHHKPYHAKLRYTFIYRLLFASIGSLFFVLAYLIYMHAFSWQCTLLLANCETLKYLMYALCSLCGGGAFYISAILRAEKEAAIHLAERAHKKLKNIFAKKFSKLSWKDFFEAKPRGHFTQAQEKIHESLETALHLMHKIAKDHSLKGEEKELLFNQALLEYAERLQMIIHHFHKNFHEGEKFLDDDTPFPKKI